MCKLKTNKVEKRVDLYRAKFHITIHELKSKILNQKNIENKRRNVTIIHVKSLAQVVTV